MNSFTQKAQRALHNWDIDWWLISTHWDKNDPYGEKVTGVSWINAYILVTKNDIDIIISSLDKDKVEHETYTNYWIYGTGNGSRDEQLIKLIQDRNIKSLALNYSSPEISDLSVDILWAGEYMSLHKEITSAIDDISITSAENIICGIIDVKTPEQVLKLEIAQKRADTILRKVFSQIKEWMTENDVAKLVLNEMKDTPAHYSDLWIIAEECSWEAPCPIVLTWKNWEKWGHATTSDTVIERGNTVYFDFWVKLTFENWEKWSSDIQRVWYFLKQGETKAPANTQVLFDTIIHSISQWIAWFKPWMNWEEADEIVRSVIREAGYDYDHATWHPIWEDAHWPWVIIAHRNSRRLLQLNNGWVYTIEPRIAVENWISVEEMVYVTNEWNRVIWDRQTELIYIKW